jgi:type VI secretion system protein ImpF
MPPPRPDQPLVPSILDRLMDDEPDKNIEAPRNRVQLMRELKAAVRRDLEWLLNTRRPNVEIAGFEELAKSLLNYGLPDFSGTGPISETARTALTSQIREIIRAHEPRLIQVDVELSGENEPLDRTLRFRINALLRADPAPEPVVFDSQIEAGSGEVLISDGETRR